MADFIVNPTETPLLDALRAKSARVWLVDSQRSGEWIQTIVTVLACLIPIAICIYGADLEPIFAIKSVEFTQPDLIVILMIGAVLLRCLLKGFHWLPRDISKALCLFFLASLISALFASDKLRAFAAILQMGEFVAIAWCVSVVTSVKRALRVVHFVLMVFFVESLIAIAQFLASDPVPRGTFFTNQHYSMFMGCGAAMLFALFSAETSRQRRSLYVVAMFVVLIGCILGAERTPWLAFLLSGAVIVWFSGPRRKFLGIGFLATICAAVIIVASVPQLRDRTLGRFAEVTIQSEKTNTLLSRLAIWGVALRLFKEHPLIGVGPKNFVSLVPSYLSSDEMGGLEAAESHNVWIGILAEGGLAGFATYTYLCYSILAIAVRKIRNTLNHRIRSLYFACLAYNIFWMVMSYHYFTKGEGHLHFTMLGLLIGIQSSDASMRPSPGILGRIA